jgi:hypothetical protein
MMASDSKKTKTDSAPKKAAAAKDKSTSGPDIPKAADSPKAESPKAESPKAESPKAESPKADSTKADTPKVDATKTDAPKAEAGENAGAVPKGYSRGEGQKPVTQAYKDNWNAIFATKKKKR